MGALIQHSDYEGRTYTKELYIYSEDAAGRVIEYENLTTTNRIDWGGTLSFDKSMTEQIKAEMTARYGSDRWNCTYTFYWGIYGAIDDYTLLWGTYE